MAGDDTLKGWVQSQHLTTDAVRAYGERYRGTPARMVVLDDFLLAPLAERLAAFLEREVDFRTTYGVYPGTKVSEAEWEAASERDRFFRYGQLHQIGEEFRLSPNALTYVRFRKEFLDESFAEYFGSITGLGLSPTDDLSLHRMTGGDFLRSHSDVLGNRRLAFILHFSRDWRPELGGTLNMTDESGHTQAVDAGFNRIVLFDVKAGTQHDVSAISSSAGDRARLSIGGWFRESQP